MTLPSRRTLRN